MAESRVKLILAWLEEHPEVYKSVLKKTKDLTVSTKDIRRAIKEATLQRTKEIATEKKRKEEYTKLAAQALRYKKYEEAVRKAETETEKQRKKGTKTLDKWGKKITRFGWRLGWLSYRLIMIGRILTRWMTAPINKAIQTLVNWEKSIESVALTMGFMAVAGMLTGETSEFLTDTIEKLVDVGPKFQAAFGYVTSTLISLMVDAVLPLIPLFYEIGDVIRELAPFVRETLVPAIKDIVNIIIEWLPELKELAEIAIPAFAEGLKTGIPLLFKFLGALEPILPTLVTLFGMLLPFAPLMMVLGTALYFVAPLISALGLAVSILGPLVSSLAGALGITGTAAGGLQIALLPLLGVIGVATGAIIGIYLAITHWGEITEWFRGVWERVCGAISGAFSAAVNIVKPAIDWFKGALDKVGGALKGTKDFLGGVKDALLGLCFKHAAGYAEEFTKKLEKSNVEIAETIGDLGTMKEALEAIKAPAVGMAVGIAGRGEGEITQYITIYPSITIGTVTGVADMDMITDAVDKGVAEALRRRVG